MRDSGKSEPESVSKGDIEVARRYSSTKTQDSTPTPVPAATGGPQGPNSPFTDTTQSLLHVAIEVFFACLPLFVLGAFSPSASEAEHGTFWQSPEWSMTACILYGLALARFLYGVSNSGESRTAGSSVAAISILPLFGVIVSIICISKTTQQSVPPFIEVFQYVNLVAAILVFLFLGGYGLNRIERHGKDETEKHR